MAFLRYVHVFLVVSLVYHCPVVSSPFSVSEEGGGGAAIGFFSYHPKVVFMVLMRLHHPMTVSVS